MRTRAATHTTVLLTEAVEALVTQPDGIYVDGTFGRGGHARAVLARLSPPGRLVAFDKDPQAVAAAAALRRRRALHHRPRQLRRHARASWRALGITQVHGVLLDLGVSSPQIDDPARGFSFRFDAPLDMRMDTTRGETAADFLARADERQIAEVIRDYGEERFAVPIAKALVARREGGAPFEPPASFPQSWLVQSRPASRARTLQRARFRLFGFTSTPSLRRSSRG